MLRELFTRRGESVDYDTSPEAGYRPVTAEEVSDLLTRGRRGVLRDEEVTRHLLTRVHHTLAASEHTVSGLHRVINEQREKLTRVGQATTLNPMDALRYLDDTQRETLFDRIARERLSSLRAMTTRAEGVHAQLLWTLTGLRSMLEGISADENVPAAIRGRAVATAATLPADPPAPPHPPLLDFPDPPARHTPQLAARPHQGPVARSGRPPGAPPEQPRAIAASPHPTPTPGGPF